jgi:hypothetical protein
MTAPNLLGACPLIKTQAMQAPIPNAELVVVEGGHSINMGAGECSHRGLSGPSSPDFLIYGALNATASGPQKRGAVALVLIDGDEGKILVRLARIIASQLLEYAANLGRAPRCQARRERVGARRFNTQQE